MLTHGNIEPHHHPPIFNIISFFFFNFFLFLINFSIYCFTFSNFFPLFYIFISPLLSILISIFLHPFIFIYHFFFLFLFLSSYYKFTILFLILYIVFPHIKRLFLSLKIFFFHIFGGFYFSCISTLGWWIFVLFGTLLWVGVIKLCVFKFLSFFILFNFIYIIILHYKDSI